MEINLRCIIVEDEYPAARLLKTFIGRMPQLTLVESFTNGVKVPAFLQENTIEILFLDIQMPFVSGTELLRSLPEKPVVVFTTANPAYAAEAFDLDVLDYLVKPFAFDRFEKAVQKAVDYHVFRQLAETKPTLPEQFLSIKSDYRTVKIMFDDITHIEGLSEYVKIVTARKNYVTLIALKELEIQLETAGFVRVHKSFIVNRACIQSYSSRSVLLKNGLEIPVGRAYKHRL